MKSNKSKSKSARGGGGGGGQFKSNYDDGYGDMDDYDNRFDTAGDTKFINFSIICSKSMVIIFNFLFIITGILVILFGLWIIYYRQDYSLLLTSILYQISTYILIASGGLLVVTGVIGIFSAWFESKPVLIVFAVTLGIIFIIQVSAGLLAFGYRAKLNESIKQDLEVLILNEYNQDGFEMKTKSLDDLQIKFKCCGANDFRDWENSQFVKLNNQSVINSEQTQTSINLVAESCCKTPSVLCAKRTHPSNINYQGCVSVLEDYTKHHLLLIGVVSFSCSIIQVLGIVFTVMLIKRINQRKQYDYVKTTEN